MTEGPWDRTLTVVDGVVVGHAEDREALTGVTVVLCREGAVGALHIRGGAVGGRQLDPLHPQHVVDRVHGVVLAGGSAFGLAAADGVMAALECEGVGFDVVGTRVPIVPTAVIFDLKLGDGRVRPDAAMGAAAVAAASGAPVPEGCVGAGTGASVGKLFGVPCATKGGLGSAGARFEDGLEVGALAVVNAFGDVRDPATGRILAGTRNGPASRAFVDSWAMITSGLLPDRFGGASPNGGAIPAPGPENTTLGVVVTNAALDALSAQRVARLAGDAFARVLSPGGTRFDGDVVFVLSTGRVPAELHRVGLLGREALEQAMLRGVLCAEPLGGLPCARDLGVSPASGGSGDPPEGA